MGNISWWVNITHRWIVSIRLYLLLLLCNLKKHGLLTYNIQRSLPVNFQYSFKWVLQMIWNYTIRIRHSGYVLCISVYNCDIWWKICSFSYHFRAEPLYLPTYWTLRVHDLFRDLQRVCLPVLYVSFKGLQNEQPINRRCNSGSRLSGCAIHPPHGRGNIFWWIVCASWG